MTDKKDADTIQYDEGLGIARPLVNDVTEKTKDRELKGNYATKKVKWFQGEGDDQMWGNLHDYEIGGIKVDYREKRARLMLTSPPPQSIYCELMLSGLHSLQMGLDEPWGAGSYVSDLEVSLRDKRYRVELCLNSGDRFIAECDDVDFTQGAATTAVCELGEAPRCF